MRCSGCAGGWIRSSCGGCDRRCGTANSPRAASEAAGDLLALRDAHTARVRAHRHARGAPRRHSGAHAGGPPRRARPRCHDPRAAVDGVGAQPASSGPGASRRARTGRSRRRRTAISTPSSRSSRRPSATSSAGSTRIPARSCAASSTPPSPKTASTRRSPIRRCASSPPRGRSASNSTPSIVAGVQDGVWPNTRLRGSLLDTWRLSDAASRDAGDTTPPGILDRRRSAMHDELRLFVRALSRATRELVVTAVDDDDTGPSVFFEFLPDALPATRAMEHPLSLRGLVALHRRASDGSRGARACQGGGTARALADAGVAGAAPGEWYGVAPLTSTAPLRDLHQEDVRVSPSRLHTLEECELNWVIGDLGGDPGGTTAGLGTIIHAALEHSDGSDEAALWATVEARWGELTFEAAWRERAELTRARDLVRRLHLYLRRFEAAGGALVGGGAALRGGDPARRRRGLRARRDPLRLHRPGRAHARGSGRDPRPEDGQERAADRRAGARQPAAVRLPARLRSRGHLEPPKVVRPGERSCSCCDPPRRRPTTRRRGSRRSTTSVAPPSSSASATRSA